ncbi:DUF6338 family protein [Anaerorhabdus sp.]|uniref:DUF6338 family protein n=1 Tax=Anaerorhabdus sp. TaxID=1872524 RepID=UPI002FCB10E8
MDLNNIVNIIPQILLLIIPGYITLTIKKYLNGEKESQNFDTILQCVLYSFIIGLIYSLIQFISIQFFPGLTAMFADISFKNIFYFVLAIFLAIGRYLLFKSKCWEKTVKWISPNISTTQSVWVKALCGDNGDKGAWVRVYLNNGLVYTGKLLYYTYDVNDETKEILLSNFISGMWSKNDKCKSKEFYELIDDNSKNSDCKVLIKREEIDIIEIFE